ncbi:FxSxx-COOH system tetratricopeptide repeat protein [Amycolatopsis sp., V23-08]|uniref:FxSxx-COOH system tetratricopeptide repeat protein n=1 Tax=Amycolatopsis heterodermiae TaxID=3110235 RepID=A0ABU5QWS5_9PSEU|nr:FxSxx-COOH system tetratricopeptide repeat protein [Amycolatopsis sp., V23-08]MEA5358363.1 FxSxx-COOH system tetratricopeptide repeat protein [Amycolatopsis sp., V23-08]
MTGEPSERPPRVGALSWNEVADAVWLAAVLGEPAGRPAGEPAPESGPPEPEPPPEPSHPDPEPAPTGDPPSSSPVTEPEPAAGHHRRPVFGGFARDFPVRDARSKGNGRAPGSSTMRGGPDILRALRPLKQLRPSSWDDDVQLDEELTAERAVQDRLWLPVLKPATTTRVLDLTVVVDAGASMALWRPEVRSFLKLVQQLGAFRTVRIRYLETETRATDGSLAPVLRGGTPDAPQHSVAELLDWYGDRLMLVLTDGVGEAWRRDLVSPLLARWSGGMPVALVHLLPQHMWKKAGIPLHRALLTSPGPFRPNRRYGFDLPDAWMTMADPEKAINGAVPIPVLELGGRWFSWWVRLISRSVTKAVPGTVLLARDQPMPETGDDEEQARPPTAQERVRRFLGAATPPAFRLATLLAAVPVSLPIARFVRAELVPEADTSHLAEVFTSGLLGPQADRPNLTGDDAVFEFPASVREALLTAGRRSETVQVVAATGERFGEQHPVLLRIVDALADPDRADLPEEGADITLERVVMRALSGPYAWRAERLHERERELAAAESGAAEEDEAEDGVGPPAMADLEVADERLVENVREEAATSLRRVRRITTDAPVIWGAVPARNPEFIGRRNLLDRLGASLDSAGSAILHGPGGLGKTQLAVEYIYRRLRDHDLVWWVSATQESQIRASLMELARQLRLPDADETVAAVPAVLNALRAGKPYRRWLIVFDAADEPEFLLPFLPVGGPGRILVTARDAASNSFPAEPIEVDRFSRAESIDLLRRRDGTVTMADAEALAEKLGDLPIALAQAAAWRAETGMPVAEYSRLLDDKTAELVASSSQASDYEISVAAAWNVSFDGLATRNPAAHQLLQVCAFFAAEPISRSLFAGIRGVTIAPQLDTVLRDPVLLDRTLREINRCRLAKLDHRSGTLLLHRLAQLVLRNTMPDETRAVMRHGAHLLLGNLDPSDPEAARQWPQYQLVLPHLQHAGLIDCDDQWVRQLVLNLMKFLYFSGDHTGALTLSEEVVTAWTERYGAEDPQTLAASEQLGFVLWVLGRYEASSEVSARTLRLYRRTFGPESEQALGAEVLVATGLKSSGDFFAARDLNRQTYEKVRSLFGDDDPTALEAAHDLVVSLLLAGDYEQARWLSEETYERRSEIFGYDNWTTIGTLNIMIICRRELGDYSWARIEQEKVVERVRGLFGSGTDGVIRRDYHLSVAQRKDGYHEAALSLSGSALERFRLKYGSDHPNVMACALAHSIDLRNAGKLPESLQLGEQALLLYRGSLGDRHPHTLAAEADIGVTLRLLGDPANALARDERALSGLRDRLGPAHPHVLACSINTANDWFELGDVQRSLRMNTDTLARLRRALPDSHPTTLAARLNRALDLERLGRVREALSQHRDVLAVADRVLRPGHPAITAAENAVRADCDIDPMPL